MNVAHRGMRNRENTINGIIQAYTIADIVEFDVRFNTNLEVILCHDREDRNIKDNETLEQLCKCEQPMHLMIDIKAFGIKPALWIAKEVFFIITKYPQHLYHLCSFNEFCVNELLRLREGNSFIFGIGIITSGIPLNMFDNLKNIDFISLEYNIICEDIVELFHKRRKLVYAWTVNASEMQEYVLKKCKVDGIIYDIFD
jgi:glycerophosphoryl diester phosphodiesterase